MAPSSVKVYAPATISNLGSGFDVIGLAIDRPGDVVVARRRKEPGIEFSVSPHRAGIPVGMDNVAAHVASLFLEEMRPRFGIRTVLHKRMPLGSGLGSSGASSVAALVAVNALLPRPVRKEELLRFAVEGERKASGSPHADNVAPCLLGGACLVRSYDPLDVITLKTRNTIVWVVVHPHLVVNTADARSVLPENVPLRTAVRQWGNVAGLVAGLIAGDAHLVGECTQDFIVEPAREHLTPGFARVRAAALDAGAHGCSFSGSGPSVFAVTDSTGKARKVAAAMKQTFKESSRVGCDVFISRINTRGAVILQRS